MKMEEFFQRYGDGLSIVTDVEKMFINVDSHSKYAVLMALVEKTIREETDPQIQSMMILSMAHFIEELTPTVGGVQ